MDLWNVLRSTARYWYLTAVVLLVGFALSTSWLAGIKPTYEADATVLFVGPRELDVRNPNPFLASGGSLRTTARAAEVAVGSPATRGAVRAAGLEPGYLVTAEAREPLLRIDVASSDPETAVATINDVLERLERDLLDRQTELEVASTQQVRAQVLSVDRVAAENDRGRSRAQIALFGLVVLLAAFLAHSLDLVRGRLRTTRQRKPRGASRPPATSEGDHLHRPDRPGDTTSSDSDSGTAGADRAEEAPEEVKPGAPSKL